MISARGRDICRGILCGPLNGASRVREREHDADVDASDASVDASDASDASVDGFPAPCEKPKWGDPRVVVARRASDPPAHAQRRRRRVHHRASVAMASRLSHIHFLLLKPSGFRKCQTPSVTRVEWLLPMDST